MNPDGVIITCNSDLDFIQKSVLLLKEKIVRYTANSRLLLGLSGGSTPKPIYEQLAMSQAIDWSKIDCFLIDERYVAPDHKDSNQHMIRTALKQNIVAPNTLLSLHECVHAYEHTMTELLKKNLPMLMILGMGEDGHIASLFPGDTAALEETQRPVLHTKTKHFAVHDRITVTMPVIQKAERVFLISGEKKYALLKEMKNDHRDAIKYPAQEFLDEKTTWITRP